jgi:putative hemolysin
MGSSTPSLISAVACGALYLLFDAARYFSHQLSPVRMRTWSGSDPDFERRSRWFQYHPQHFSLATGALLQISLIAAVGFTIDALRHRGVASAILGAIILWGVVSVVWKALLAFVPEEGGESLLRAMIPLTHLFYYFFWPVLYPLGRILQRVSDSREADEEEDEVTEEEIQAYIDVGEQEGILEGGEGKLLQSIVDFGDRIAREVMTPRIDMLAFDASGSLTELAALFNESKYARIPLYETTVDRIVGVVHVKDLFGALLRNQGGDVRAIARPAYFVPETKEISELLREFQIEHIQLAIVVDEFGGTAGLITIEDLLEEIVGEIADEHEDDEETIVEVEGGYLVNGAARTETLQDMLGADVDGEDYETVAGLIFTEMGRVPRVGEVVVKDGIAFEVDRADRRRIYRVRVTRVPPVAGPPHVVEGLRHR